MDPKNETASYASFGARLALAWKVFWQTLGDAVIARQVAIATGDTPAPAPKPAAPLPPERAHAPGLFMLSLLQREGRLIDFLQEDVASFSDADVGAAARVVHAGCKKTLAEYITLEPALKDAEGATVTVPTGFDAQRIRLTGNVTGQPPFRGSLKHHGWVASSIRLPALSDALDPRVIAPAEVEL